MASDVLMDEVEWPSFVSLAKTIVPYERPNRKMVKHLKPLFITTNTNGKPMSRVFVYPGAMLNVMPLAILRKLGKLTKDML